MKLETKLETLMKKRPPSSLLQSKESDLQKKKTERTLLQERLQQNKAQQEKLITQIAEDEAREAEFGNAITVLESYLASTKTALTADAGELSKLTDTILPKIPLELATGGEKNQYLQQQLGKHQGDPGNPRGSKKEGSQRDSPRGSQGSQVR